MNGPELRLLLGAVLAVAGTVFAIARLKTHAFPTLIAAALFMGLWAGLPPPKAASAFGDGFGAVLGGIGPILGLGAIIGALVSSSGAADRIAESLTKSGRRGATWWMAGLSMLIGAPLFFETGVVMMMPIVVAVGARLDQPGRGPAGSGYVRAAIPMMAGLSAMHGLLPPHPGPLIAVDALNAPLGRTFLYGLVIAVPTVILSGPVFAGFGARIAGARPPPGLYAAPRETGAAGPGLGLTLGTLIVPVVLILIRSVADVALAANDPLRPWADFIGHPTVALLIGMALAVLTLGRMQGLDRRAVLARIETALPAMASILLVIGAGGGFKQVLVTSGVGTALGHLAGSAHVGPLLLGWLLAVAIRLATGSATVATITASGLMASALHAGAPVDRALLALSIGGGSLFFSHVNDAGFWMVREYLGTSIADTFKTWSVVETIISVMILALSLLLSVLV